jgi:hypothetical protein
MGRHHQSVIVIRSGRHPHEVFLLVAFLLWALFGLIAFEATASPSLRLLPTPWGHVFYGALGVGAVVAIVGVFLRRGIVGPLVERSGMLILSGMNVAYAVFVFGYSGSRAAGFSIFMVCLAAANIWRAAQIPGEVKQIAAAAALGKATDHLGGE